MVEATTRTKRYPVYCLGQDEQLMEATIELNEGEALLLIGDTDYIAA